MNVRTSRQVVDTAMPENPALATFEAWMSINRPMVAAMTELNGRFIEQVSKANNEWLGFLNRRINEDIAASQRILECKTPQDFFTAASDFFQRAQAHYQAEFQYFARLNQKLANETASAMKTHIEEVNSEMRH